MPHPLARRGTRSWRVLSSFLLLLTFLCAGRLSVAQAYTSIVVLGDSLSDVGNDATLSNAKYGLSAQVPGPLTGYTNGRFTDGSDTLPAAHNYAGVWVEQLAAQLTAKPAVMASLNGGRNYAYGFATTGTGTTPFTYGPGNAFSFTVNNMGQQLQDYLASVPTINSSTLFVVWGGANDLLNATSSAAIVAAATREVGIVQQLIAAGATDIIVPNLPPLGLIPRLNGSAAAAAQATAAAQGFNQALTLGLAQVQAAAGRAVRLYPLDVYTLFNTVVGPPVGYGFANVKDSSQANATVNPDTYLFWDDLHPTTYGHSLIAAAALRLLGTPVATTVSLTSSASSVNAGSSVMLTANVAASSGVAAGTITFLDGTTVLGSRLVGGSTTASTASLATPPLTAGPHMLTASFAGVNGFGSSTSSTTTVVAVAPSYALQVTPVVLIARGASGTVTVNIVPTGGYTGSFTVACGTVAKITCSVAPSTVSITSTATASSTVTIGTANVSANVRPALPGLPLAPRVAYACLAGSLLGGLSLARRRSKTLRSLPLFLLPVLLSMGVLLGISGCGGDPLAHDTPVGSYSVPVTITPASGTATTVNIAVTVN